MNGDLDVNRWFGKFLKGHIKDFEYNDVIINGPGWKISISTNIEFGNRTVSKNVEWAKFEYQLQAEILN